jgi:hypothetical protein
VRAVAEALDPDETFDLLYARDRSYKPLLLTPIEEPTRPFAFLAFTE